MAHLSLSQGFLVPVPKLAVSLQPASPLSSPFSPPPQHLASLEPTIILALSENQGENDGENAREDPWPTDPPAPSFPSHHGRSASAFPSPNAQRPTGHGHGPSRALGSHVPLPPARTRITPAAAASTTLSLLSPALREKRDKPRLLSASLPSPDLLFRPPPHFLPKP